MYNDPKNCGGCGYNYAASAPVPQFVCANGTVCCGLAGCLPPTNCSAATATNTTSRQTSIFPTPINAVRSPDSVLSAPLTPAPAGDPGAVGPSPVPATPVVAGDPTAGPVAAGDPTAGPVAAGDPTAGPVAAGDPANAGASPPPPPPADGGPMIATAPPAATDPDTILPISVVPGRGVAIPAVPNGLSASEARAALAAASARAAGVGANGGLGGMAAGDVGDGSVARAAPLPAGAYGGATVVSEPARAAPTMPRQGEGAMFGRR